jgi:hypothetical protein
MYKYTLELEQMNWALMFINHPIFAFLQLYAILQSDFINIVLLKIHHRKEEDRSHQGP